MASVGSEEEEYQEDEVWSLMKHTKEASYAKPRKGFSSSSSSSPSSSNAWGLKTKPRSIPRVGAHEAEPRKQASAPLDIPDWSKIKKKKSSKNLWDDACVNDDEYHGDAYDDGDYDDDGDDEMVPPHEYLAKKLARTQIASFSMCEGVGRTLKGRDLSRLRNAILTKTGFLE